jgi:hypothetical protein
MDKVLIVSHHFAQSRHFRSTRVDGLVKFLPEFGWEPVVLTSDAPKDLSGEVEVVDVRYHAFHQRWKQMLGMKMDQPMKDQVAAEGSKKSDLTDVALRTWERVYGFPDPTLEWVEPATEAGMRIMARGDIRAILSSSGPGASHIVASRLKAGDTPWVADFRDLWAWDHNDVRSPVRRLMNEKLERETLATADVLTTVSRPLAEKLERIHGRREVHTITNGFDPNDMPSGTVELDERFTVNYTGKVYRKGMDPAPFFDALKAVVESGQVDRTKMEVNFYGDGSPWFYSQVEDRGLQDIVKAHPSVPRQESLDIQRSSQLLLIIGWDNTKEKGVYTGKVFDYLAAKRPILSVGSSEDVIGELLKRTGTGLIATDQDELRKYLLNAYNEFIANGRVGYQGEMSEVMRFSHRTMAKEFSKLLSMGSP